MDSKKTWGGREKKKKKASRWTRTRGTTWFRMAEFVNAKKSCTLIRFPIPPPSSSSQPPSVAQHERHASNHHGHATISIFPFHHFTILSSFLFTLAAPNVVIYLRQYYQTMVNFSTAGRLVPDADLNLVRSEKTVQIKKKRPTRSFPPLHTLSLPNTYMQ